jgi:hypothetical protein
MVAWNFPAGFGGLFVFGVMRLDKEWSALLFVNPNSGTASHIFK